MLAPTEDQRAIAESARDLLRAHLPISRMRTERGTASAYALPIWKTCAELGWFSLSVPGADGGVGFGLETEIFLHREVGRALAPGPFLPTALAVHVAAAAGMNETADAFMKGTSAASLVAPRAPTGAVGPGIAYDADGVDHLLIVDPDAAYLVRCDPDEIRTTASLDPGVSIAHVNISEDVVIAEIPADRCPAFLRGSIMASATLAGMAEALRDMSVRHAKERVQFGEPIGVNQAVKHPCADLAVHAEVLAAQVQAAAKSLDESHADADRQASAAKVIASGVVDGAATTIQIHGGMGFTFEHNAHLYLTRAHHLATVFGSTTAHLERLMPEAGHGRRDKASRA